MPTRKYVIDLTVSDDAPDGYAACDEFFEATVAAFDLAPVPPWVQSLDGMEPARTQVIAETGWYSSRFGFHPHPEAWPINMARRRHVECRRATIKSDPPVKCSEVDDLSWMGPIEGEAV